jgi:RimJ/RimL family protein N-acetyltransferase
MTTFSTVAVGPHPPVNPLLIDLPEQIETERLIVRPPRFGDGPAVNAAIRESIAELRPWMPWAQTEPTIEETEANLRNAVAKFAAREDLRLQLHLKDGTFVGSSGLHRIDWTVPKFEIGYWVSTPFAGKGYVSEAVAAFARLAFETLRAARV